MASGDNKGLKVTVGILAALMVVFAGIAAVGLTSLRTANENESAAKSQAQRSGEEARRSQNQTQLLLKWIGHEMATVGDSTAEPGADTVIGQIKEDMEAYATDAGKDYRSAVTALAGRIAQTKEAMRELESANQQLQDSLDFHDQKTAGQVDSANSARDTAREDADTFIETFAATNTELVTENLRLENEMNQLQTSVRQLEVDAEFSALEHQERSRELGLVIDNLRTRINELEQVSLEVPDGKIRLVSAITKTVTINLGKMDNLPRQMTFSVFDKDALQVGNAKPKAKIEVVKVIDDEEHLAVARIVEQRLLNPILEGDLIYNPGWSSGREIRFAIAGRFDLDGDGRSDRDVIKRLIREFGGVVGAEVVEGTGEITGKIDHLTDYMIVGDRPEVGKREEGQNVANVQLEIDNYSKFINEARIFASPIQFRRFMDMMGYKPRRRMYQIGSGQTYNLKSGSKKAVAARGMQAYEKVNPKRVSSLYIPGESLKELQPHSRGVVSGLYQSGEVTAPRPRASSGVVSGLYQSGEVTAPARSEAAGDQQE